MSIDFNTLPQTHLNACITIGNHMRDNPDLIEVCQWRGAFITVDAYQHLVESDMLDKATNISKTVFGAELVAVLGCILYALSEEQPYNRDRLVATCQRAASIVCDDTGIEDRFTSWQEHNVAQPVGLSRYALMALFATDLLAMTEKAARNGNQTRH